MNGLKVGNLLAWCARLLLNFVVSLPKLWRARRIRSPNASEWYPPSASNGGSSAYQSPTTSNPAKRVQTFHCTVHDSIAREQPTFESLQQWYRPATRSTECAENGCLASTARRRCGCQRWSRGRKWGCRAGRDQEWAEQPDQARERPSVKSAS
jgi:hypothetical protein